MVARVGKIQELLELPRACEGAALPEFQQLAYEACGLVPQGGGNRALVERRHAMTAGVDRFCDPAHLIDAGDDSGGQLVKPSVDGVALLNCKRTSSFQERDVGADTARIDLRIE
jgi:hypothetical protein